MIQLNHTSNNLVLIYLIDFCLYLLSNLLINKRDKGDLKAYTQQKNYLFYFGSNSLSSYKLK